MKALRSMIPGFTLASAIFGMVALSGVELRFPGPAAAQAPWTENAPSAKPAPPQTAEAAAGVSDIKRLNQAFTDLAERVSPAVVNIYTKAESRRERRVPPRHPGLPGMPDEAFEFYFGNPFFAPGPSAPREALGSGFVINEKEGYIVTNAHVVRMAGRNADEIMVKFIGEENDKGHAAKIVGVDEMTDVALLKLTETKKDLKAVALGDSDRARVGEWVVAIGNPYGHTNTVTQGIVSALGRSLEGVRAEFLQTSASINPGNSGGPLINVDGEVIGINTAIDPRAQGIGFAIPINTAKRAIEQLAEKGRVVRPWMGIAIQNLDEEIAGYMKLAKSEGVLVKEVMDNQPADKAGVEVYDVITKVNGKEVKTTRDLLRTVDQLEIGKTAEIEVLRGKESKRLKVKIGEQPAQTG